MKWSFENDRPIYLQLVEQLKVRIVSGIYPLGSKLPSVRELALETQVNPNTMQKALQELENDGWIVTQRTNGKFVTEEVKKLQGLKKNLKEEKISRFLSEMKILGFSLEEIITCIEKEEKK